jgi:spermidine/putrescine transport system substrate-binding protein
VKANVKFFWTTRTSFTMAALWRDRRRDDVGHRRLETEQREPEIQYIAPKSGHGLDRHVALPARGRNDAAAYAWINFNMRPEIAAKARLPPEISPAQRRGPTNGREVEGAVREELPEEALKDVKGIRQCRRASRISKARCSIA